MSSDAAAEAGRQLRELTACGYPMSWIARKTSVSRNALYAIRAGRRQYVWHDIAETINDAYRQLDGTTPEQHGIPHGDIGTALLTAGRNGWTTRREVAT